MIEVLIALVVIALTVTALLGGLVTAITSSAEHRSLATIDTLLKSFAETAKYQLEEQTNPLFNCGVTADPSPNGYVMLSSPNPSTGPAGDGVTLFGTGFTANDNSTSGWTVYIQTPAGLVPATVTSASSSSTGNATVTFTVPGSVSPGSYPVVVTSGSGSGAVSATTPSDFQVVASGKPVNSALSGYKLGIKSVENWSPTLAEFVSGCPANYGLQLVTLSATAPNHVSDTLSFVVSGIPGDQAPVIDSADTYTFTVGSATIEYFDFTATGYPAPTFSVSGALPSGVSLCTTGGLLCGIPAAGTGGTYAVTVTATNSVGSNSQQFTLVVDQSPAITSNSSATFTEGSSNSFTVTASAYPAATFSYSAFAGCTPSTVPSTITLSSTGQISGSPTATGTYTICVTASNGTSPNATQVLTLVVGTAPIITSGASTTFTTGTKGSFTVVASGYPAPTFTETGTLPSGVTLNPSTGVLSGTATSGGSFPITITATNAIGTDNQSFTLTVDQAPSITSANATTFTVGTNGSFTVQATAYPTAVTFSETGTLPTGVTFSSSGVLSGTPAAGTGGSYAITITASNGISPNGSQAFTLSVNQGPVITSANSTTFTVGTSGSFTVTATGHPTPTFTESGTLPTGVTLSSSGLLSGTPAANTGGTYPITITATNGVGTNATQSFTLTVDQSPAITSANSTTFTAGKSGSFQASATGYPAPSFSDTAFTGCTPSTLPSGITFSSSGLLSGSSSTDATYTLCITATNGVGTNATQAFTLVVGQAPTITSGSSTTFSVGVAGTFQVTSSGYPAATYSESGTLPNGITLNPSTGVLSGTPASGSAGTYNITITATNVVGSGTQSFTLTVKETATAFTVTVNAVQTPVSIDYGQSATLAESGLPSGATGTVTFTSGATTLCTITLPATSCATSTSLAVGSYSNFTGVYSGDGTYLGSTSGNALTLTVTKDPTSFSITVNGSSTSATIGYGQSATLAESGLPSGATGTVTFTSGGVTLCTITLPATSCTTSASLSVGTYPSISGSYSGNGDYSSSTSSNTLTLTVNSITFVQQVTLNVASNGANTSQFTLTLSKAITAGDALVLVVADQSSNGSVVQSVAQTGATWTKATSTGSTSNGDAEIWYALDVPATASTTITVNLSARTNVQLANVSEWEYVATSGALDKTHTANNSTGTSVSAGAITPSETGELIISDGYASGGNSTQPSPNNGFSSLTQSAGTSGNYKGYGAYLIDTSAASISTTWTQPSSGPWASAIASFEP